MNGSGQVPQLCLIQVPFIFSYRGFARLGHLPCSPRSSIVCAVYPASLGVLLLGFVYATVKSSRPLRIGRKQAWFLIIHCLFSFPSSLCQYQLCTQSSKIRGALACNTCIQIHSSACSGLSVSYRSAKHSVRSVWCRWEATLTVSTFQKCFLCRSLTDC